MNAAFHRSDAVETLEELSFVILTHLVLLATFRGDKAQNHWKKEIKAFAKTLQRYNNGKKGRSNFVDESYVFKVLQEKLQDSDEQQRIETLIFAKGYDLSSVNISWLDAEEKIKEFSQLIFQK